MFEDIFEFNKSIFYLREQEAQLKQKYGQNVNLYNNFDLLRLISKDQLKEVLTKVPDEIACIYCASILKTNNKNKKDIFDLLIVKLIKNQKLLFKCLFNICGMHFCCRLYEIYHFSKELIFRKNFLGLLYSYIQEIYNLYGIEFFKQVYQKINFFIVFFLLFYPYFTQEMFNIFVENVIKIFYANEALPKDVKETVRHKRFFFYFLKDEYVQKHFPFADELNAILFLYKIS